MPIVREFARYLVESLIPLNITGSACALGRLWHVEKDVTYGFVRDLLAQKGRAMAMPSNAGDDTPIPSDIEFMACLGFDEYHSLDVSAYENPTHTFDMNSFSLPAHLSGRYDIVLNFGTMEHVFHIPNFLSNMTKMLRPGGRVFHICPLNNQMDHGYYMFSPCLFFDYYQSNRFDIEFSRLVNVGRNAGISDWSDWGPSFYDPYALPSHDCCADDFILNNIFIARRNDGSLSDQIPFQGLFVNLWKANSAEPTVIGMQEHDRLRLAQAEQIAELRQNLKDHEERIERLQNINAHYLRQLLIEQGILPRDRPA